MLRDWMNPSDLAPGDVKSLEGDWSSMELHRVHSADDPDFDIAFGALWAEFGARSEVEQPTVLFVIAHPLIPPVLHCSPAQRCC